MTNITTVQLDKSVVNALKEVKEYPRQTYNEIILSLINHKKKYKMRNQYDEFLHKIQQSKMSELWDNKADEAWQNA